MNAEAEPYSWERQTFMSRLSQGTTHLSIQWVWAAASLWVKWPGCEADKPHQLPKWRMHGSICAHTHTHSHTHFFFMDWCLTLQGCGTLPFLNEELLSGSSLVSSPASIGQWQLFRRDQQELTVAMASRGKPQHQCQKESRIIWLWSLLTGKLGWENSVRNCTLSVMCVAVCT